MKSNEIAKMRQGSQKRDGVRESRAPGMTKKKKNLLYTGKIDFLRFSFRWDRVRLLPFHPAKAEHALRSHWEAISEQNLLARQKAQTEKEKSEQKEQLPKDPVNGPSSGSECVQEDSSESKI